MTNENARASVEYVGNYEYWPAVLTLFFANRTVRGLKKEEGPKEEKR